MLNSIKKTLKRLSVKIHLPGFLNVGKLYEGIAIEFNRTNEYKNKIVSSIVPNKNMDIDTLEDYNNKYGVPNYLTGTDEEKINRLLEKASLSGNGGLDFLQEQIRLAGFDLYVIENYKVGDIVQFNKFQHSISIQMGSIGSYIDPDDVPGELVVGSPPRGFGKLLLTRFNKFQHSSSVQMGSPDLTATYPQPVQYEITDDPKYWGFYFFLSPFSDRIAVNGEELELDERSWNYLYKLILELKHKRNWCIAQIVVV